MVVLDNFQVKEDALKLTDKQISNLRYKCRVIFALYNSILAAEGEMDYKIAADIFMAKEEEMVGRCDVNKDTILRWERDFRINNGTMSVNRTGQYTRPWLFEDSDMRMRADNWIAKNSVRKVCPRPPPPPPPCLLRSDQL